VENLIQMEGAMRQMLDGIKKPYDAGWEIWRIAGAAATSSHDLMWPMWLIWGALTDRFELRTHDSQVVEDLMIRAATEWLSLDSSDSAAASTYLDRWVYDELGYEKKV
jgi:hypothetical protein